eukprot:15445529-Alexandrium_andersonii.AAC.1
MDWQLLHRWGACSKGINVGPEPGSTAELCSATTTWPFRSLRAISAPLEKPPGAPPSLKVPATEEAEDMWAVNAGDAW